MQILARVCFALTALTLASLPWMSQARAAHRADPNGLGVVLGEPSGLSGIHWVDAHVAFDGALAYNFEDFFEIYGDYLYHFPGAFGNQKFITDLDPYIGGGAFVLFSSNTPTATNRGLARDNGDSFGLGLRLPLGIEWAPSAPPIGVFVELVPGVGIIPGTFGYLEADIGVRWYF